MIFIIEGKALYVLHVLICGEQYAFQIILAFSDLKIAATLTDLGDWEERENNNLVGI